MNEYSEESPRCSYLRKLLFDYIKKDTSLPDTTDVAGVLAQYQDEHIGYIRQDHMFAKELESVLPYGYMADLG
ncbi:hypothetical protein SDC9_205423 [bioreactor metagenome]|uniref:Uncharacterized protein n=1 Tax=bioreactor metagenome TaxID=1076179 RepID=A0A645J4V7_9ZZZZ